MKKFELVLLSVCTFVMASLNAMASEPDFINDAPLESVLSHGTIHEGGILRSIVSLTVVVGMIYLTAWLYKKLNKFNNQKFTNDNQTLDVNKFKIVSSQTLGMNRGLYVVEINGKYLVLGATQSNISLLKEFDKKEIDIDSNKNNKKEEWMSDLVGKYGVEDKNAKGN